MGAHAATAANSDSELAESLARDGFAICEEYWSADRWLALATEAQLLRVKGGFRRAGVGRGTSLRIRPEIRSDYVCWIDPDAPTRRQRMWLERMELLRQCLNQHLYLGLSSFESHFAVYPPGSFYQTHLDRFADASLRTVSTILYLNPDWAHELGGALRLHLAAENEATHTSVQRDIMPTGGTFVCFLSAEIHHEVLPASRERWSIVGWFSKRR